MHRAAHILNNTEALPAPTVARRLDGLCGALCRHRACAGDLADGVDHFLKVTRSYRPGLFHCHAVADLPGTNNGLEGLFGSYRYCQRRTTGRRSASSATVVRGPARLVASVTSHLAPPAIWPLSIGPAGKRCAPTSQHAGCNEPEEAASDEIRKLICASWKLNMPPPSKLCRSGFLTSGIVEVGTGGAVHSQKDDLAAGSDFRRLIQLPVGIIWLSHHLSRKLTEPF